MAPQRRPAHVGRIFLEQQRRLPACHRQIHPCQQLGVDQRAVNVTFRRIDRVTLAKRVEAVALPGMNLARQRQRVEYRRVMFDLWLWMLHELEFVLEKTHVE